MSEPKRITRMVTRKRKGDQFKIGDTILYFESVGEGVAFIVIEAPEDVDIDFSLPKRKEVSTDAEN